MLQISSGYFSARRILRALLIQGRAWVIDVENYVVKKVLNSYFSFINAYTTLIGPDVFRLTN